MENRTYPYIGKYKAAHFWPMYEGLAVLFDKEGWGTVVNEAPGFKKGQYKEFKEITFDVMSLPDYYQIKVNNKEELLSALSIFKEQGYNDYDCCPESWSSLIDEIKYLIVHANRTLGGNFKEPYSDFKVIDYKDFIILSENQKENKEMKKGNFIIGSIHKVTGEISFAKKPYIHTNFMSASNEAEKLAKQFQEKKFIVVECKGICSVQQTIWE